MPGPPNPNPPDTSNNTPSETTGGGYQSPPPSQSPAPKPPKYGQHTGQSPAPTPAPSAPAQVPLVQLTGGTYDAEENKFSATRPIGTYDPEDYGYANQIWQSMGWMFPQFGSDADWAWIYNHPQRAKTFSERLARVEKMTGETLPSDLSLALAESWISDQELEAASRILSTRIRVPMTSILPIVRLMGQDGNSFTAFIDPVTGMPISMRTARRLYKPYEQDFFRQILPTLSTEVSPLKIAQAFRGMQSIGREMSMEEGVGAAVFIAETLTGPQIEVFGKNMRVLEGQALSDEEKIDTAMQAALRGLTFSEDIQSPDHYVNWRLGQDIEIAREELAAIKEDPESSIEDIREAEGRLQLAERSADKWKDATDRATTLASGVTTGTYGQEIEFTEAEIAAGPDDSTSKLAYDLLTDPASEKNHYELIVERVKADVANADADFKNSVLGTALGVVDAGFDHISNFINAGVYSVANLPMLAATAIFDREELDERSLYISDVTKDLLYGRMSLAEQIMEEAPYIPQWAAVSIELAAQVVFDPLNMAFKPLHAKKLIGLPLLDDAVKEMGSFKYFWNAPLFGTNNAVTRALKLTFGERYAAAMSKNHLWLGRKTIPQFLSEAAQKYDNYEDFWAYAVGKLRNAVGTDALPHEIAAAIHEYHRWYKEGKVVRSAEELTQDTMALMYAGIIPSDAKGLPDGIKELLDGINKTADDIVRHGPVQKLRGPAGHEEWASYAPEGFFGPPAPIMDDDLANALFAYQAYQIDGLGKMRGIPTAGGLTATIKVGARHLSWGGSRYRRSVIASLMPTIEHGFPDWVRNFMYRGKGLFKREEVGDWVKEAIRIVSPGTANREVEWIKYLTRLNDEVIKRVGKRYGLSASEVENITKEMRGSLGELNNKLFGYEPDWMTDTDKLLRVSLVETQLPNRWVMTDPTQVARMVQDHLGYRRSLTKAIQRTLGKGATQATISQVTARMMVHTLTGRLREVYLRAWKAATVATLRYVLRVPMFDEQLRIMADISAHGWWNMRQMVSEGMGSLGINRPEMWSEIKDVDFLQKITDDIVDAGFRSHNEVYDALKLEELGVVDDPLVEALNRLDPYYKQYYKDTLEAQRTGKAGIPEGGINRDHEFWFPEGSASPAIYDPHSNTIFIDGDWVAATKSEDDFRLFVDRVYASDGVTGGWDGSGMTGVRNMAMESASDDWRWLWPDMDEDIKNFLARANGSWDELAQQAEEYKESLLRFFTEEEVDNILGALRKTADEEERLFAAAIGEPLTPEELEAARNAVDPAIQAEYYAQLASLREELFVYNYRALERRTYEAEARVMAEFGPPTEDQWKIFYEGDWEEFSRARGYTEAEISEYRRFHDMNQHIVDRGYEPDWQVFLDDLPTGSQTYHPDTLKEVFWSVRNDSKRGFITRLQDGAEYHRKIHGLPEYSNTKITLAEIGTRNFGDVDNIKDAKVVMYTGTREGWDKAQIAEDMKHLAPDAVIHQGGANGVDAFAGEAATASGRKTRVWKADWKKFGNSAGQKRNIQMLQGSEPDLVIAYWNPASKGGGKGTLGAVAAAWDHGVPLIVRLPKGVSREAFLEAMKKAMAEYKRYNKPLGLAGKARQSSRTHAAATAAQGGADAAKASDKVVRIRATADLIPEFQGEHRWLSNFYGAPVEYKGVKYNSAEHAFQAAKALDPADAKRIAEAATPYEAKKIARSVQIRPDWNEARIGVMRDILREKFNNPALRNKLLATGNATLVEGNRWGDKFWGQVIKGQNLTEGENHLGRLLMEIREELRPMQTTEVLNKYNLTPAQKKAFGAGHSDYVYIGRGKGGDIAKPGEWGEWGNPFKIGPDGTREEVIAKYKAWFEDKLKDPEFRQRVAALRGKKLVCFDAPKACHGDIIKEYVESLVDELPSPTARVTPDVIRGPEDLPDNAVFVFGSNTDGRHGAGAALMARQRFGAVQGQAVGLQGNSYAIVTKDLGAGSHEMLTVSIQATGSGEFGSLAFRPLWRADDDSIFIFRAPTEMDPQFAGQAVDGYGVAIRRTNKATGQKYFEAKPLILHRGENARWFENEDEAEKWAKNWLKRNNKQGNTNGTLNQVGLQDVSFGYMKRQIEDLMDVARATPDREFVVTKLGTGLAGFKEDDMIALFRSLDDIPGNVRLPDGWLSRSEMFNRQEEVKKIATGNSLRAKERVVGRFNRAMNYSIIDESGAPGELGFINELAYSIDDVIPEYLKSLGFEVEKAEEIAAALKSQMFRALAEARREGRRVARLDEYWFETLDRRGFRRYSRNPRDTTMEGFGVERPQGMPRQRIDETTGEVVDQAFLPQGEIDAEAAARIEATSRYDESIIKTPLTDEEKAAAAARAKAIDKARETMSRDEFRRYMMEQRRMSNDRRVFEETPHAFVPGYPVDLNTTIVDFMNDIKYQLFERLRARRRPDFVKPPSTREMSVISDSLLGRAVRDENGVFLRREGGIVDDEKAWSQFLTNLEKNLEGHPQAQYILSKARRDRMAFLNEFLGGTMGQDAQRATINATMGRNYRLKGNYLQPVPLEESGKDWQDLIYGDTPFGSDTPKGSPSMSDPLRGDFHTQLGDHPEISGYQPGDHRGYWLFDAIVERYRNANPNARTITGKLLTERSRLMESLGVSMPVPDLRGVTVNHEMGHALLEAMPENLRDELVQMFAEKRVLEFDEFPGNAAEAIEEIKRTAIGEDMYRDELHELFADAWAAYQYDPALLRDFDMDLYNWFEVHGEYFQEVLSKKQPTVKTLWHEDTPERLVQKHQQPRYGELEDEIGVNSGNARDAFGSREREMRTMLERMAKNYKMNERLWGEVTPEMPQYFSTLEDVLRNQHGRSELSRRILLGISKNDSDEKIMTTVVKWLREDEVGRNVAGRLQLKNLGDMEERVDMLTHMLRGYIFNDPGIAEGVLKNNPKLGQALKQAYDADPEMAQAVNGFISLEASGLGHPFSAAYDTISKWIFELPTNKLARQPFFKYWFTNMKEGLVQAAIDEGRTLTPDMLRSIETQARAFAIERADKVLFDFRKQSRFGELMGFIAPFFQPWKEAFQVWGHLLRKNPWFAERARVIFTEMLDSPLVTEDKITGEKKLALSNMWFAAPMMNMLLGHGGLKHIRDFAGGFSLSASFTSFNFLFGSTFEIPTGSIAGNIPFPVPSLNPLLMLGAQQLADSDILPDFMKLSVTRWAYQYGDLMRGSGDADLGLASGLAKFGTSLLPTYIQHLARGLLPELTGGEGVLNSQANDFLRMYEAQGLTVQTMLKMDEDEQQETFGETFENSPEGAQKAQGFLADMAYGQAKDLQIFRWIFSFVMPAAPTVSFPTADLEAEYRDLVEQHGYDMGRDIFLDRHPDNALITIPTTYWNRDKESIVPMPANQFAQSLLEEPEFKEFAEHHPEWAFALLPSEVWEEDYDRTVFFAQMSQGLRLTRTPTEFLQAYDRDEGWDLWRAVRTDYENDLEALQAQGFSTKDPLAITLQAQYDDAVEKIRRDYPGFDQSYGTFENFNINPWVDLHVRAALESDLFRDTQVGQALLRYREIRTDAMNKLAHRNLSSIESATAADIKREYDARVDKLIQKYPDFERAYGYYFEDDLRNVTTNADKLIESWSQKHQNTYEQEMKPFLTAYETIRQTSDSGELTTAYIVQRGLSNHWWQEYGWTKENPQWIWWKTRNAYDQRQYRDSVASRPYQFLSTFEREIILGESTNPDTEARIMAVSDIDAVIANVRHDDPFASTGPMYERRDKLVQQFMREDPRFAEWVGRVNTWGYAFFAATKYDQRPGREGEAWRVFKTELAETQHKVEVEEWHGDSDYNPVNRDLYQYEHLKLENLVESLKLYSDGFARRWISWEESSPGAGMIDEFMPTTWFRYGG